jgi:hypothetical protein
VGLLKRAQPVHASNINQTRPNRILMASGQYSSGR